MLVMASWIGGFWRTSFANMLINGVVDVRSWSRFRTTSISKVVLYSSDDLRRQMAALTDPKLPLPKSPSVVTLSSDGEIHLKSKSWRCVWIGPRIRFKSGFTAIVLILLSISRRYRVNAAKWLNPANVSRYRSPGKVDSRKVWPLAWSMVNLQSFYGF